MKELIDVFRMKEIPADIRIKLIKKLGRAINDEHGMNLTEEVVEYLVSILEGER